MEEFIRLAIPCIIGGIIAIGTWLYNLVEKRINARADETKALQIEINRLDKKVAVLESEHNQFSQSLKAISEDLKKHIDDKIESLREIFTVKLSSK
jgi:archaellum component FlaC